jgi:hypothetical protein
MYFREKEMQQQTKNTGLWLANHVYGRLFIRQDETKAPSRDQWPMQLDNGRHFIRQYRNKSFPAVQIVVKLAHVCLNTRQHRTKAPQGGEQRLAQLVHGCPKSNTRQHSAA